MINFKLPLPQNGLFGIGLFGLMIVSFVTVTIIFFIHNSNFSNSISIPIILQLHPKQHTLNYENTTSISSTIKKTDKYQTDRHDICVFIFGTTKTFEHIKEVESCHNTWVSQFHTNNVWYVFHNHEKSDLLNSSTSNGIYSNLNLCNRNNNLNYDNCIFLPNDKYYNFNISHNINLNDSINNIDKNDFYNSLRNEYPKDKNKLSIGKKLFDFLYYLYKTRHIEHKYLKNSCRFIIDTDSDAYVDLHRLSNIFECLNDNESSLIGPIWNKIPVRGLSTPYPSGFGMAISNQLFHLIFKNYDRGDNIITTNMDGNSDAAVNVDSDVPRSNYNLLNRVIFEDYQSQNNNPHNYEIHRKMDNISRVMFFNNSISIFENCYNIFFSQQIVSLLIKYRDENNKKHKKHIVRKMVNAEAVVNDDVGLAHCLFTIHHLDRINIEQAKKLAFPYNGLYMRYAWPFSDMWTVDYILNEKNKIWFADQIYHKINFTNMIIIHDWYIKCKNNVNCEYYDLVNDAFNWRVGKEKWNKKIDWYKLDKHDWMYGIYLQHYYGSQMCKQRFVKYMKDVNDITVD